MAEPIPDTAPVKDHRTKPRGVLPRHTQTWIMVGLAVAVLGIILFAGQPESAAAPSSVASPAATLALDATRLRDFQDRIRVIDARTRQEVLDQVREAPPAPRYEEPPSASSEPDPVQIDRRRREYQSLFASNVVLTRRPEAHRLTGTDAAAEGNFVTAESNGMAVPPAPTLDEVAEAVMRAASRQDQAAVLPPTPATVTVASLQPPRTPTPSARPAATGPITGNGPLHRLLEGTLIDAVLMNRLDGSTASPVTCLVTNAVYSHSGQHVLIPAGSRVIGHTTPVQTVGETRLAVTFHRLALPDGRTYSLEHVTGLNQVGDAGLSDQVDHHYWSTFGASGAVGLVSGLAQMIGTGGWGANGDRTVVITGGAGNATAQATTQTMGRFLNRLPTVTIREGHRVKVYLTGDLELPAYEAAKQMPARPVGLQLAGGRP
jgi:type IV secretion system protein TrbI